MNNFLAIDIPMWVPALFFFVRSVIAFKYHIRTPFWVRVAMMFPTISLVIVWVVFYLVPIPLDARSFIGRAVLLVFSGWDIILLYTTRKLHS